MTEINREPAAYSPTRLLDGRRPEAIALAAGLLLADQPVAFPTDTVYGVGVLAFSEAAIAGLYRLKQRPLDRGIPILLSDTADLPRVCRDIPELALALIQRFWPGPLTLIVPRHPDLPQVIAPDDTIAVRIPDNEIARSLIRASGGALATSSANLSSQPPATSAAEALTALDGLVAAVLDGGPTPGNQPSTIVDCTGPELRLVRQGLLVAKDLGLTSLAEGVS